MACRVLHEDVVGAACRVFRVEDPAVGVDLQNINVVAPVRTDVAAGVSLPAECNEEPLREISELLGQLEVGAGLPRHLVEVDPFEAEVLERLPGGKLGLDGLECEGLGEVVRIFGDEDGELSAFDELFDEGAAEVGDHLRGHLLQLLEVVDPRFLGHSYGAVAVVMLDNHRIVQRAVGPSDAVAVVCEDEGRSWNSGQESDRLHVLLRRLEEGGRGSGKRKMEPLQCLNDLNPSSVLVKRAVAQIDENVEFIADVPNLLNSSRLFHKHIRKSVAGREFRKTGRVCIWIAVFKARRAAFVGRLKNTNSQRRMSFQQPGT
mmetsp:Transcript_1330/g.2516  ORF Transcript_1330/g.2516 Transcript_1330/m.2516 type:complete len:318 (+) Transcript_1330:872-1825(+)